MADPDMTKVIATRMNVQEWLVLERRRHADPKWANGDNRMAAKTYMAADVHGQWWFDYIDSYLHRASLLGLDTPSGRQALGKAVVTAISALETAVEVYGALPEPGVSSGEIRPWNR